MMRMLIDDSTILKKFEVTFQERGLEVSLSYLDLYVLIVEENVVYLTPVIGYQNDMQCYYWDSQYDVVSHYRMEPIDKIDHALSRHDTICALVYKMMVLDIPNEKLVKAIQALHPGYKSTYKVMRNYLTDGLMFRVTGEGPEEDFGAVTFEHYLMNTLQTINANHTRLREIVGRNYYSQVSG